MFRTASDPGINADPAIYDFMIDESGNIGIGTISPPAKLEVAGRTKTNVLEITGSDFAEPFEISNTDSLPLGSLVVIDPEHPGMLKQATEPYDKKVAGVISGAGGIYPGIIVTKENKLNGSQYVALTGKVYALATAANGPIEPGDLLTTSPIPGHAMKAADQTRWPGTVIGKAMSSLDTWIESGFLAYPFEDTFPTLADNDIETEVPTAFELLQNYPNPFNPETTIDYQIKEEIEVTIEIYNIRGQLLRTLVDKKQAAGAYSLIWDGKDDSGKGVASGIYLYLLKTKEFVKARKLTLLR